MSLFAKIDDQGVVTDIIVASASFITDNGLQETWVAVDSSSIGIGDLYNFDTQVFSERTPEDTISAPVDSSEQDTLNKTNRDHLNETDWYVIRHAETGVAIPQDILDSRAAARAAIVEVSNE